VVLVPDIRYAVMKEQEKKKGEKEKERKSLELSLMKTRNLNKTLPNKTSKH
jgi:hypothetical protein